MGKVLLFLVVISLFYNGHAMNANNEQKMSTKNILLHNISSRALEPNPPYVAPLEHENTRISIHDGLGNAGNTLSIGTDNSSGNGHTQ